MATTVKSDLMQYYMGYVTVDSSIVLCAKSFGFSNSRASSDQQYLGSDSTYTTLGADAWTASLESDQVLTQDVSAGTELTYTDMFALYTAKTQVTLTFLPDHTDVSSGQKYLSGTAVIESLDWSIAAGEAPASWTASFKGIGALEIKTSS